MALLLFKMALLLLTVNVNGLRDPNKRESFMHWLHSAKPDLVCLQELHLGHEAEARSWFSSSGYVFMVSPGSVKSSGVAILFKPSFSLCNSWKDTSGRFLMVELKSQDSTFRVATLYAPNRNPSRNQFFEGLFPVLDPSIPTFITGDFNTVLDPTLDRRGSSTTSSSRESSAVVSSLFADLGLVDIWRHLHPGEFAYTWTRPDGTVASRIDLIGCPSSWIPNVSSCSISVCPYSDHDAVFLSFSPPSSPPRGPGFWKLNVSVLDEPAYLELIRTFWSGWKLQKSSYHSIQTWWDMGKFKIKNLTIKYCTKRAASKRSEYSDLSNKASNLKSQIDSGHLSALDEYKLVLNKLKLLDLADAKGAQVRARVKWCEEGESSSAYFCRLEKKRSSDSYISSVRLSDDTSVSDMPSMLLAWFDFYKSLFSSVETDPAARTELLSNLESSLQAEEAALCEGALSLEEAFLALKGMSHRKSPGYDGLPMEFYVTFWDILGEDLVSVLNRAHVSGVLSLSQRRGIITLVFKKGDRPDRSNWRPITLLNVDYKIASQAIAGRLLKVIHLVVSSDQTCGVPGRFIGENVRLVIDAIEYANEHDLPLAVLSLAQEKAFDRVEWSFLLDTLSKMGFGPSFVQWVHTFYSGPQSAVNVNGYVSEFFSLSRGVRQGCPLSPLLYVLAAEVLACNIRASSSIHGLTIPGASAPAIISQYANDTCLLLCSDSSIREAFSIYSKYELGSGAKLNLAKCKGLWSGSWRFRPDPPVNLRWSSDHIHSLGVDIGNGNHEHDIWSPRIQSFSNVLLSWRQRSLSFQGKALVSNALALSGLWYVASIVPMPDGPSKKSIRSCLISFGEARRSLLLAKRSSSPAVLVALLSLMLP